MGETSSRYPFSVIVIGLVVIVVGMAVLIREVVHVSPERAAVRSFTRLVAAVNRADLETARSLCSASFLETHPLSGDHDASMADLPEGVDLTLHAKREGDTMRLQPSNPHRMAYQMRLEDGVWKFDGAIQSRGDATSSE